MKKKSPKKAPRAARKAEPAAKAARTEPRPPGKAKVARGRAGAHAGEQNSDSARTEPRPSSKAEEELAGFLAKYTPGIAAFARAVRAKLRARLPGAIEMVYDNYNALVIGYVPGERPSEAIFSIVLFPRWVTLCFLQGAGLPDPKKLLKGSGRIVRHIVLNKPEDLDKPAIETLIEHALDRAVKPLDPRQPHRLIIKSISEKQRPRRP